MVGVFRFFGRSYVMGCGLGSSARERVSVDKSFVSQLFIKELGSFSKLEVTLPKSTQYSEMVGLYSEPTTPVQGILC